MAEIISSKAGYKTTETESDFSKYGHPGKWKESITVGNGETLVCTGSNFGAGAVLISNSDTTIYLSDGGSIPGTAIGTNTVFEGSIEKVENGASGLVYVLIRNQVIR